MQKAPHVQCVTFDTWLKGAFTAPKGDKSIDENPHVPDEFKEKLDQAKRRLSTYSVKICSSMLFSNSSASVRCSSSTAAFRS